MGESHWVWLGAGFFRVRHARIGIFESEKEYWRFEDRDCARQFCGNVEGIELGDIQNTRRI